jgi:hypothetical protein
MSNFILKALACILMLIDHIGAVFFPKILLLRVIGRLAFPIFSFLLVEGYVKTSNFTKYASRLILFAFISQYPFKLAFNIQSYNIFYTLLAGLMALYVLDYKFYEDKLKNTIMKVLVVFTISMFTEQIHTDYGYYGVLMIVIFKLFREQRFAKLVTALIVLNIIYIIPISKYLILPTGDINFRVFLQSTSLLALLILYFYNGERGKKMKYLFYAFYPVHLMILYLIKDKLL